MAETSDRPGILAPPPLLTLAAILLAWGANRILPLTAGPRGALRNVAALAVLATAVALLAAALRALRRHRTTPNPYRATTAIVASGIYAHSRNPIYLAFLLIVVAAGLAASSWWYLAALVLLFVALRFGVVAREERYLSGKFGAAYDAYRRDVRRWL